MTKVLMVCLGNICRSPMAEGIFRSKVKESDLAIEVDSAGTSAYHVGSAPDSRQQATALAQGIDISGLRARQFCRGDFDQFDIIYAMDNSNYENILKLARSQADRDKVKMILNESHPDSDMPVPDPYYGGQDGFMLVYNLLEEACDVIIQKLSA